MQYYAPAHRGVFLYDAVVADHREFRHLGVVFHLDKIAENHRPAYFCVCRDFDVSADPHGIADFFAGKIDPHLAVKNRLVYLTVRMHGAHIAPVSLGNMAVHRDSLRFQQRDKVERKIELRILRYISADDLRFHNIHAGIHRIAENLTPRGLFEKFIYSAVFIQHGDSVFDGRLHPRKHDRELRFLFSMKSQHLLNVEIDDAVAAQNNNGLVDAAKSLLHAAGRTERYFLDRIRYVHIPVRTVAEVILHTIGKIKQADSNVRDGIRAKKIDRVLDNRFVDNRNHRFWAVAGKRAQSVPLASGHDYRFHKSIPECRSPMEL